MAFFCSVQGYFSLIAPVFQSDSICSSGGLPFQTVLNYNESGSALPPDLLRPAGRVSTLLHLVQEIIHRPLYRIETVFCLRDQQPGIIPVYPNQFNVPVSGCQLFKGEPDNGGRIEAHSQLQQEEPFFSAGVDKGDIVLLLFHPGMGGGNPAVSGSESL